jgi:hypothetical protein
MSYIYIYIYIYGAPSKARNLTSCIHGRDFLLGILLLEEQSIEYCGAHAYHVTRHNTPIHNILSTAQFSISQKALGTLPEDGNVMPKHVGTTIHN